MISSLIKRLCLPCCIALLPSFAPAQQTGIPFPLPAHPAPGPIAYAEYFWDTDPGPGNGAAVAAISLPAANLAADVPVSMGGLGTGVHQLYFRVRDVQGTWSMTNRKPFFIVDPAFTVPANPPAAGIIAAEYFIDIDPGTGNGTPVAVMAGTDISMTNIGIDISGLSNGTHTLYFRVKDNQGNWSLTSRKGLSVVTVQIDIPQHQPADVIKMLEYFVDNDPGWGNGDTVVLPSGSNIAGFSFPVNISTLSDGYHHLHVRTSGNRSLTNIRTFYKGVPLPVNLATFTAALDGKDVQLSWAVTQHHEPGQFETERSVDGKNFSVLKAIVTDATDSSFNATDVDAATLKADRLYYRLKIKKTGQPPVYSQIAALELPQAISSITISAAPNPFIHEITLNCLAMSDEVLQLSWLDINGSVVLKNEIKMIKGFTRTKIDTPNLLPGVYVLRVKGKALDKTIKLVKKDL